MPSAPTDIYAPTASGGALLSVAIVAGSYCAIELGWLRKPLQGVTVGALNTYVAIGNSEAVAGSSEDLTQLRIVMMSRAHIERAKGMLMERHKITDDEAFTLLTRASQRTNTKLRDVAAELVRTGTLPSRA